jgi:hypothetical protein
MVGREAALAELESCLDKALRGQRQVIFVSGEAGIGKTTLVDAFHHRATRPHLRMAWGLVLKSASVAGERFSVWAITPTLDIEPDHIENLCDRLAGDAGLTPCTWQGPNTGPRAAGGARG